MKKQKVSDQHSISRDIHGSWFIHDNKGKMEVAEMIGPLPTLIDLHHEFCELGGCGERLMRAAAELLDWELA